MTLWEPYDIPVVGLAGEVGSGKTLWGLMADPNCLNFDVAATTYTWDTEGSSASYVGAINFDRMDIPAVLFKKLKKGTPEDAFLLWRDDLKSLHPNKYRVLMLDTITTIESGLVSYVKRNPAEFGYTANQFLKLEGLMWGAMKTEWKRLILIACQKCETLVLTTHMRNEYRGGTPTNRREPKGKETIGEVASIYLTLSRKANPGSDYVQVSPSGICMQPGGKSRLVRINPHTMSPEPLLPPHIKDASPAGIRDYLKNPPDFANLEDYEQAVDNNDMSDDDRLYLNAGIASDLAKMAEAELQIKENGVSTQETANLMDNLKEKTLSLMTVEEAKVMLHIRYNVQRISNLTSNQLDDLEQHLNTLGK